ncbi:hypothetical protein [Muricoccus aerilatus]|uniref:hypothetical protein n=1 Tax=Muricoccus aerilatus TaxID=452982 RepID=UPI0005C1D226|nr:hypothetical protein [Roseomonas aerilata]
MRTLLGLAPLLLATAAGAQTPARLAEGGPPTSIITPGRETRTMGQGPAATRTPVATPAASPATSGGERAPGPGMGTAQRPTPDQSR